MLKKIGTFTTVSSLLLITACSGGGPGSGGASGSEGPSFGQSMTAQFIDAPVKGLKLSTENGVNTQTGAEGKFSCKRGEQVSFSVGELDLGYAACGEKIFVHDLVSSKTNHSWDQAAAILQTFSVDKGSYLDLSSLDQDQLDLTGISYQAVSSNLNLSAPLTTALSSGAYDNVPVEDKPSSAVSVANAIIAANTSLGSSVSLPSQLDMVLDQLKEDGVSSILLNGELVSETLIPGVEDATCWKNIKAKSSVQLANGVYTYSVDSAVSYDDSTVIDGNNTCISAQESAGECETANSARLPRPKIITSESIDMIFSNSYVDQEFGVQVKSRNVLSLNSSIKSSKVNFSGIYENKITVASGPLAGQSLICKYKISGSKTVQTNSGAKYNGSLQCFEGGAPAGSLSAQVEVFGTFPNATSSIKIEDGNGIVWSKSNVTFQYDSDKEEYSFEEIVNTTIGPVPSGNTLIGGPEDNNLFSLQIHDEQTPSKSCYAVDLQKE